MRHQIFTFILPLPPIIFTGKDNDVFRVTT